ncbi:antitoxin YezG family protein [Nocardiopsis dassonvillei]|uniref:immunity protein YezG family protein n=1 Tax=Nocardiopsis dassonvillei TaxID=2014 RepID=UPI0020A5B816|nr:immunity protein YezG family protein [Nocardiopsis dassonvillei]MCP3013075.1 antitoxin YezG family protein [Nocardiopsis dassonvillei]
MVSKFFKRGHLDHAQQQKILKEAGTEILKEAPEGWERITYSRESVIDHSSSLSIIELASGESVRKWPPVTVGTLFDDLRAGMYKDGKGTWFSLEYVITRPGKFKVRYNYDEDPHILFPTAWGFTNDLKYFPRDEEHIPEWLHEKLREEAEGRATE